MLFMLELFLFFSPESSFLPKMLHTNWTITVEKSEHTNVSHAFSMCDVHPETLVWRGGNYFWSLMFALCSARSCVPTPPSAFLFNDIEWTCRQQLFVELVWLIYHLPNMQDSNQEYGDFTLGRWMSKIMPFSNRPLSHTSSRQNFGIFPLPYWGLMVNMNVENVDMRKELYFTLRLSVWSWAFVFMFLHFLWLHWLFIDPVITDTFVMH